MRNSIFVLIKISLLSLLAVLAACDGSQQASLQVSVDEPESKQSQAELEARTVLESFINASIARQYSAYYDLLSEQDRAVKSREDFLREKQAAGVTLADAFYDKISYQIEDLSVSGDRAQARVKYNFPNVEFMIKDMFGLSILSDFTDAEIVEMKRRLDEAYQSKPVPVKSSDRQFVMLREANGWRVLLGWNKASVQSSTHSN